MIDFTLTSDQNALRQAAQSFAKGVLSKAPETYKAETTPARKFQSIRPFYEQAVTGGLIKGQIPTAMGGSGGSLVDAAILVEELYAVESSASLTILGTGLGLTPLILGASDEQRTRLFQKFLSADGTGEHGAPMASLVFSEPGGSANWLEKGGKLMQTTATKDGEDWILSGEKIWTTNSGGWDFRGADVQCVVCRRVEEGRPPAADPRDDTMVLVVTREDIASNAAEAYTVLAHPETLGHTAVSGPHSRFTSLRVSGGNLLARPGHGAALVEATFTGSAALVGAMAVGLMRRSFELALSFAKSDARGGSVPILSRQSVADLLVDIKMRCEASRSLVWRACHALATNSKGGPELAYEAKVFCSDNAVQSVVAAMNAVGISSYSSSLGFGVLMNDALCLPIFDGGNVGIRRRQIEGIFAADGYDPWAATYGESN